MTFLSPEALKVFNEIKARPQTMNELQLSTGYTNRSLAQILSNLKKHKLIERDNSPYFTLSESGKKESE